MNNYTQNVIDKQIQLKNMFQRQQDKLLSLIYPKRKVPTIEIIELKKALKKTQQETFRNIKKNETQLVYESKKRVFVAKKTKRLNEIAMRLTKVPQYYLSKTKKTKKINKLVKYASYWNKRKPKKIMHVEVTNLRRYKRKKIYIGQSLYLKKIKRWTKLSEKRAKSFMSELKKLNEANTRSVFATYNREFYDENRRRRIISRKPLILNKEQQVKYKKLKVLKKRLLSKISAESLIPASKHRKAYSILTIKQRWLARKLVWLKIKNKKNSGFGIDFFKTILGQRFISLHKRSQKWTQRRLLFIEDERKLMSKAWRRTCISNREMARKLQGQQRRAWHYTNTVFPKKLPYFFQQSSVTKGYPYNKFTQNWKERSFNPWLHALVSKRILYSGSLATDRRELKWLKKYSWIPLLRNRLEYRQKKKKIYYYRKRLLFDQDQTETIYTNKKARIKQVLSKVTLPFYGNLNLKQFAKITKKTKNKKSTLLASDEIQLNALELRLDVVVLRLNLAPNILWARRLIKDGSIFVSSTGNKNSIDFEKMYANYKQNAYPLKLRDPQNLYKKTQLVSYTNYDYQKMAKLKFLLEPLRNIDYLTKPGDVILCAPGSLINQYKTNKNLWQKPVPTHLLTFSHITEVKNAFKSRSNALMPFARKEQTTTNVGFVLFNPTFFDLQETDRIQRSFMRWMSL